MSKPKFQRNTGERWVSSPSPSPSPDPACSSWSWPGHPIFTKSERWVPATSAPPAPLPLPPPLPDPDPDPDPDSTRERRVQATIDMLELAASNIRGYVDTVTRILDEKRPGCTFADVINSFTYSRSITEYLSRCSPAQAEAIAALLDLAIDAQRMDRYLGAACDSDDCDVTVCRLIYGAVNVAALWLTPFPEPSLPTPAVGPLSSSSLVPIFPLPPPITPDPSIVSYSPTGEATWPTWSLSAGTFPRPRRPDPPRDDANFNLDLDARRRYLSGVTVRGLRGQSAVPYPYDEPVPDER